MRWRLDYSHLLNLALAVPAATACAACHRRFGRAGRAVTIVATVLLLAEFYVVNFPGGPPRPLPVPAVYRYIATLPAGRAVAARLRQDEPLVPGSG